MLLSIVPVYDERATLGAILCIVARGLPTVSKEIVVGDCSRDGTREWLKAIFPDRARTGSSVDLDNDGQLVLAQNTGPPRVTIRQIFRERTKAKAAGHRPDLPP